MSLRDEITPYIDGNGLVAPGLVAVGAKQGSDNGPMYTSELYVMYEKLGMLTAQDKLDYAQKIGQCINSEGMLCRVPIGQDDGQEQVDDYYGVLNGCYTLGNTDIPRKFLKSVIKNWGFMDNENPGSHSNWSSFMPRQLQLMASLVSASFPGWNPINILIRKGYGILYWYAAIVIFISCIGAPSSDTDSRRLAWHLIQSVENHSLLCKFAATVWYHRLYATYGSGMKGVAKLYYQAGHPFAKYWVTE